MFTKSSDLRCSSWVQAGTGSWTGCRGRGGHCSVALPASGSGTCPSSWCHPQLRGPVQRAVRAEGPAWPVSHCVIAQIARRLLAGLCSHPADVPSLGEKGAGRGPSPAAPLHTSPPSLSSSPCAMQTRPFTSVRFSGKSTHLSPWARWQCQAADLHRRRNQLWDEAEERGHARTVLHPL